MIFGFSQLKGYLRKFIYLFDVIVEIRISIEDEIYCGINFYLVFR